MKNLFVLIVLCLTVSVSFSQETKAPTYELKGKLIKATMFHDNGVIAQTGFYTESGKLQGEWNSFNQEGTKTATAFYDKGAKVGTWIFYSGNEMKKVAYKESRIAEVNTWTLKDTRVVSNNP